MRSLEEIADNPRAATISDDLVLVADPYEDFSRRNGKLTPETVDVIIEALKDKFIEGQSLVTRFRSDLMELESSKTNFRSHTVGTVYEKLELMLKSRPVCLVQQAQKLWRSRDLIETGRKGLTEDEQSVFETTKYTHQWHQQVEKPKGYNPFEPLKRILEYGITVLLRENANAGYPCYIIHGWQEKVKTRERIIKKLLFKTFEIMKDVDKSEDFYKKDIGTDYFGHKVIGVSRRIIENMIAGLVYRKNSHWEPRKDDPEDYRVSKGKEGKKLRAIEYVLRYRNDITTERLQVQVTTLPDFFLDEFFDKDSHPLFRVRRDVKLQKYRRSHPKLYDRMERAISEVLTFLPI